MDPGDDAGEDDRVVGEGEAAGDNVVGEDDREVDVPTGLVPALSGAGGTRWSVSASFLASGLASSSSLRWPHTK